jgi:hypothetical protein
VSLRVRVSAEHTPFAVWAWQPQWGHGCDRVRPCRRAGKPLFRADLRSGILRMRKVAVVRVEKKTSSGDQSELVTLAAWHQGP